jgi:hypothetical protein
MGLAKNVQLSLAGCGSDQLHALIIGDTGGWQAARALFALLARRLPRPGTERQDVRLPIQHALCHPNPCTNGHHAVRAVIRLVPGRSRYVAANCDTGSLANGQKKSERRYHILFHKIVVPGACQKHAKMQFNGRARFGAVV